jgi:hypothetical protein
LKPRKKRRGLTLAEIPIRDHGVCGNFECGKILPDVIRKDGRWRRAPERKFCSPACIAASRVPGSAKWLKRQKPWALEMLADVLPTSYVSS